MKSKNGFDPNRVIAKLIVLAQISSDAGKGYHTLETHASDKMVLGYSTKERFIAQAINLINSTPKCGWKYWCLQAPDQNGYKSILVYFEHRSIKGQCSFHTPFNRSETLSLICKNKAKGVPMEWDHQIGGSQSFCRKLIDLYNL